MFARVRRYRAQLLKQELKLTWGWTLLNRVWILWVWKSRNHVIWTWLKIIIIGRMCKRILVETLNILKRLFISIKLVMFAGTPMVGADGNPVVMQPAYQQVMVKSGPTAGFTQASTARSAAIQSAQQTSAVAQPQQPQQQSQQQQQGSGQIVIPQYIGLQQPVYVMPSSNRAPYTQQQAVSFPCQYSVSPQMYALSRDFNSFSLRKF